MDSTDLIYGTNPGCVAQTSAGGGTPGQCGQAEAWAVPHLYKYPRPQLVRLYACEHHGRGRPDAEPLTEHDRRTIAERRRRRDAQMEPARRRARAYAGE